MVVFIQQRKRHLPQREDQALSSVKPINRYPRRFAHSGRSQTVDFYSTSERCRVEKRPKRRGPWELQLWNSKQRSQPIRRWSGDALSGRLVWNQLMGVWERERCGWLCLCRWWECSGVCACIDSLNVISTRYSVYTTICVCRGVLMWERGMSVYGTVCNLSCLQYYKLRNIMVQKF